MTLLISVSVVFSLMSYPSSMIEGADRIKSAKILYVISTRSEEPRKFECIIMKLPEPYKPRLSNQIYPDSKGIRVYMAFIRI